MPETIKEAAGTFDVQDNRPIKIWAQDEARFGRMNNPKKCWAPPQIRPIVHLQRIRQYLYVFSAASPETGETYSLILPVCNSDAMKVFLEGLAQQYKDYRNIIIADQAAWHVTKKLQQFDNIRFIFLPAGSPELNQAEHLWEHIREKYLGNRIFNSLDQLEDELVDIIGTMSTEKEVIKNLTGFYWIISSVNHCC